MTTRKTDTTHDPVNFLDARRNRITSHTGIWRGGDDVISHGHSLMHEMMGEASYMQLIVLNATGRMVERRLGDWLEANFIGMSYPDPRIWCNFIGAMGGSVRTSVAAATLAGTLGSDSRAYGGSQTAVHGMRFIQTALRQHQAGEALTDIIARQPHKNGRPIITGFARPVDAIDERIEPMRRITRKLGFETGPHLSLADEIDSYLEHNFGQGINIGGYKSAFLSDQGFTPEEVYAIKSCVVASGVTACYLETEKQPPDTFLPLRCDDIEYTGPAPRPLSQRR